MPRPLALNISYPIESLSIEVEIDEDTLFKKNLKWQNNILRCISDHEIIQTYYFCITDLEKIEKFA